MAKDTLRNIFLKKKIFFININSKNELTVKHKIIMIMITVIKHA